MRKIIILLTSFIITIAVIIYSPATTSDPGATPADEAREDLSRFEYPSMTGIKWRAHFIMPHEDLESLFGESWIYVARFNRIDRRHVYPGMTIKIPENIEAIKNYNPLPSHYEPAKNQPKYVLVDVKEQWLGAYEYGVQVFSTPAATGIAGHLTPTGIFKVEARHKTHTSSLYKTHKGDAQYPMDYAIRFLIDDQHVSYWIHARDMPGRPASHGCIGVYDEDMQKRVYGVPEKPVINDAALLYNWVADGDTSNDGRKIIEMEEGPVVEIKGELPLYRSPSPAPGTGSAGE